MWIPDCQTERTGFLIVRGSGFLSVVLSVVRLERSGFLTFDVFNLLFTSGKTLIVKISRVGKRSM